MTEVQWRLKSSASGTRHKELWNSIRIDFDGEDYDKLSHLMLPWLNL